MKQKVNGFLNSQAQVHLSAAYFNQVICDVNAGAWGKKF